MRLAKEIQQQYQSGTRDFTEENLTRQNLSFQTLDDCDFSRADLSHANLSHVSFKGVNFQDADLSYSICTSANFTDANLSGAILTATNLSGAILTNAVYDHHTQFPEGFDPETTDAIYLSQPPEIEEQELNTSIQPIDESSETKHTPEADKDISPNTTASENIGSSDIDQSKDSDKKGNQTGQKPLLDLSPSVPPPVLEIPVTTIQSETEAISQASAVAFSPKEGKKKKICLILLAVVTMPALGGLAFTVHSVYQTYQTQQSFLQEIKKHRESKNYQSCLDEISNAESEVPTPLPVLDFSEQLKRFKESCTVGDRGHKPSLSRRSIARNPSSLGPQH